MNSRDIRRDFDRMAASRMRLHTGGLPLHTALASRPSISLRFKLKRMGLALEDDGVADLLSLVDEVGLQENLSRMPLSVRYATVARPRRERRVWGWNTLPGGGD